MLRTSLWFVPAIEVAVAIALFIGTLIADRAAYRGEFGLPGWVISGSADAARQILTTIAAAIITVVGVVFSIILVTLTLASTQFGPRMLRNFIRDRGTQLTLGTFVATFVYAVLVLVSIGTGSRGDFVPHISVTVTLGLMVADLAVLIYFIHHTAVSIQLPQVIASIAGDLTEAIAEQGSGNTEPQPESRPDRDRAAEPGRIRGQRPARPGQRVPAVHQAPGPGQAGHRGRRGDQPGVPARALRRAPGTGSRRSGRPQAAPLVRQALGRAHLVGPHRTLTQDVSFGIDQLVEICATRALRRRQRRLHRTDLHRLARGEPVQDRGPVASGARASRRLSGTSGSSRPSPATTGWSSGPSRRCASAAWASRP